MADRIVMGYWDCKYCGTNGIEGTRRDCPNCGHPRDKDVKFYMKSRTHEEVVANNEYLSEKQADVKGKGADWECSFCGALNSVLSPSCKSCGHPREESDLNYFQMRAREDGQNSGTAESVSTPGYGTGRDDSDSSGISFGKTELKAEIRQGPLWKKILLAVLILLALFGIVWAVKPHPKTLKILNKKWEYSIQIEEYRYVADSGWDLPPGADLNRSAREVHHYNTVIDHYETKTRYYEERVQTGSHTEYSYSDNGDGTFTEHSYSVPDYGYETRSETYRDPVYIQVPVYATKYYYHLWRWVYKRDVKTSGVNNEPYYGEMNLNENERKGGTREIYSLDVCRPKKTDDVKNYGIVKSDWFRLEPGSVIRVKVQDGRITEIE